MKELKIRVKQIQIPMRSSFKHASAERKVTDSVWVEAERGGLTGLGEGCPRTYVTGENSDSALQWIESHRENLESSIGSLGDLKDWILRHKAEIDANPAAWCAIETALLDLLARERGISLESLLGVDTLKQNFRYTAVLGDEAPEKFEKILYNYFEVGFLDFKFKIGHNDQQKFELFKKLARMKNVEDKIRLRLDGNNLWAGQLAAAKDYLSKVPFKLYAVEEPLAPRDVQGLSELSTSLDVGIVLDESLCRLEDLRLFDKVPGRWIVNVRVSKMGGILRSLELVEVLRLKNFQVVVGAQVGETSVLTRAALTVAQAASDLLVAQEGAFGNLLLEKDPVEPVLQFGAGGVLQYSPSSSGLGLERRL